MKITQKYKNMILNDFENRFLNDFLPQGNPKKTKQGNYEIASQEICRKSSLISVKN